MTIELRVSRLEGRPVDAAPVRTVAPDPGHVANFVTSPMFLGQSLYPTQLLIVKLITLAVDLLTDDDHRLIADLVQGYSQVDDLHGARFDGTRGTVPDLMERIEWCRQHDRTVFSEAVLVMGRRAGKSLITAIVALWEVWRLLMMGDPQAVLHVPAGKKIAFLIFGTTRENAVRDLFGDVKDLLLGAPCFAPFIEHESAHTIRLWTPAQLDAAGSARPRQHGRIVLSALPTVPSAARGVPVRFLAMDECAYLDTGDTSIGSALYAAATPAMLQFKGNACAILPSTPASKAGVFFEQARQATQIDPFSERSLFPDRMLIHLPSWAAYDGWVDAYERPMWAGGPNYPKFDDAKIELGEQLRSRQIADPDRFRVEIEAQWATMLDAFLSEDTVQRIFGPHRGALLSLQSTGDGQSVYIGHGDPSISDNNFALVVAHSDDHDGETHVVVDWIHVWKPADFEDHHIDYTVVETELLSVIERFRLARLTFDQFNSQFLVQRLLPQAARLGLGTSINTLTTTKSTKWDRYMLMKTLANQGLLHAPFHELALQELRFLCSTGTKIGAPTSGPVTTDDIADALSWVVSLLAGTGHGTITQLTDLRAVPGMPHYLLDQLTRDSQRARGRADVRLEGRLPRWHPLRTGLPY
jgi:hypothetical protein